MTDQTEAAPADAIPQPRLKRGRKPKVPPLAEMPPPWVPPPEVKVRKIAVLGSAVSSVHLAPFDRPDWEIWGCSPANRELPRCDVWFELHNVDVKIREGLVEWIAWLNKQPNVFMQKASPEFPNIKEYPLKQMIAKYGRYWWTSQLSYMLALAIDQKPKVIGIYGVDMAANSEYNQQRLACQFFMLEAAKQGIDLVVPPESDLLEPPPLYGYQESSRRWRKFNARKIELNNRIASLENDLVSKQREKSHLVGALDDMEYHLAHWANTSDFNT